MGRMSKGLQELNTLELLKLKKRQFEVGTISLKAYKEFLDDVFS